MRAMRWTEGLGRWSFRCAAAAIIAALGFALAARADLIAKLSGFGGVAASVLLALIGFALGLVALAMAALQRRRPGGPAIAGLALSAVMLTAVLVQILPGRGAPAIHDVTTDPADPPRFAVLRLAPDNLRGIGSLERWRALHARHYGDLRPLSLPLSVTETIAKARGLAEERGWEIAAADPQGGRLEATDSVSLIGFKDDIVITAAPAPGGGSIVNARSVSRVGISDVGVNANRLREFLAALAA